MTDREAMKMALEALDNNRRNHYYCEDTWYSCPKHEDGCANDSEGNECNCGADKANQEIDSAITALRQALAQPEPQVCCGNYDKCWKSCTPRGRWLANKQITRFEQEKKQFVGGIPEVSQQRQWVGLTDDEMEKIVDLNTSDDGGFDIWCDGIAVAHIVCAKLKEKNA